MVLNQKVSYVYNERNHSKCERCILRLMLQLMQVNENDIVDCQQQIWTKLMPYLMQLGIVIVTFEGQVQFMTQRGEKLLRRYFSPINLYSLPRALQHWFEHQIASHISDSKSLFLCSPFYIEQVERQLSIRLIFNLIEEQYLLLLEEQELKSFSISSLKLLGLTKRESEVLFWIANDRSNAGIARILGCSEGTVRKHLEHLYKKLGVQSRTAAVMVSLKKLGLLKEQFVTTSS